MRSLFTRLAHRFSTLKKTALYDWHLANKGKLVEFAGTYPHTQAINSQSNSQREYSKSISIPEINARFLMSVTWVKSKSRALMLRDS